MNNILKKVAALLCGFGVLSLAKAQTNDSLQPKASSTAPSPYLNQLIGDGQWNRFPVVSFDNWILGRVPNSLRYLDNKPHAGFYNIFYGRTTILDELAAPDLNLIDPYDLSSVAVIRDGFTSQYGYFGSNGVLKAALRRVVFETPLYVNFSTQIGFNHFTKNDSSKSTGEQSGGGFYHHQHVSVSKGWKNFGFYSGIGWQENDNNALKSSFNNVRFVISLRATPVKWLCLGAKFLIGNAKSLVKAAPDSLSLFNKNLSKPIFGSFNTDFHISRFLTSTLRSNYTYEKTITEQRYVGQSPYYSPFYSTTYAAPAFQHRRFEIENEWKWASSSGKIIEYNATLAAGYRRDIYNTQSIYEFQYSMPGGSPMRVLTFGPDSIQNGQLIKGNKYAKATISLSILDRVHLSTGLRVDKYADGPQRIFGTNNLATFQYYSFYSSSGGYDTAAIAAYKSKPYYSPYVSATIDLLNGDQGSKDETHLAINGSFGRLHTLDMNLTNYAFFQNDIKSKYLTIGVGSRFNQGMTAIQINYYSSFLHTSSFPISSYVQNTPQHPDLGAFYPYSDTLKQTGFEMTFNSVIVRSRHLDWRVAGNFAYNNKGHNNYGYYRDHYAYAPYLRTEYLPLYDRKNANFGLQSTINYKSFDLYVSAIYVDRDEFYDPTGRFNSVITAIITRQTIPAYTTPISLQKVKYKPGINQASIGYTFGDNKRLSKYFDRAKVYVSANNLFMPQDKNYLKSGSYLHFNERNKTFLLGFDVGF